MSTTSDTEKHDRAQPPSVEIAIFSATSALLAYTAAADRLELCAEGSFSNGGTTPSLSTLKNVISSLQQAQADTTTITKTSIPIYAMIRPRGGDFVYSTEEFDRMKEQLLALKIADYDGEQQAVGHHDGIFNNAFFGKVNGFVFGILTKDGKVDRARNEELVRFAAPLPCTFHRAFDEVITSIEQDRSLITSNSSDSVSSSSDRKELLLPDALADELEAVIDAGFASILTSGGTGKSALEGARQINALTCAADGRVSIIAGGGVRSSNIGELQSRSPRTPFFHSSAIVGNANGQSDVVNQDEVRALKKDLGYR
jgi:copper homeostasis protein